MKEYFWLHCKCSCGGAVRPRATRPIGITTDHRLIIVGKCKRCKNERTIFFPLTVLYKACKRPCTKEDLLEADKIISEITGEIDELTDGDKRMLRGMLIGFMDPRPQT